MMVLIKKNLINQGVGVQCFTKSLITRLLDVYCCRAKKDRKG